MATMGLHRKLPIVVPAIFALLFSGLNRLVSGDQELLRSSSPKTSFSLEELMLLSDVAEKAQKKGANEEDLANVSNFQHRLRQVIQTARVAAGSGQSTGSDVLDQTIRQVRARINASGGTGSVSDTSIFDAALKAIAGNAGSGSKSSLDSSALVDTIVNQLSPDAPTTPSPADNSFIGGILRQLSNNDNGSGRAIFDAVVKQLVSTTTTTTTTTTPKPEFLEGLVRAFLGRRTPQEIEGRANGGRTPASPSPSMPDPTNLLEGFKNVLQQIQGRQGGDENGGPGGSQGSTGPLLLETFINQLKQLQNRGASSPDPGNIAGSPFGESTPDLTFLQNLAKQFQSRLKPGKVRGHSVDSATPAPADAPIGLEGFEGFIPEGRKSGDVDDASQQPTSPVSQPSSAGSQKSLSSVDPNQLLGGFLRQLGDSTQQAGGGQSVLHFLTGLSDKLRNTGR
ncbi:uncharacterized protein LOC111251126 [Varroa destructor]|uniref:Uncharacterized protein n=1 Tax=Varroa destructor TaxID=109461 RepID=A0A7M7KMJ6_VARDE|nr:uncharacterized protein LOC111251126 [Varroa destructor]